LHFDHRPGDDLLNLSSIGWPVYGDDGVLLEPRYVGETNLPGMYVDAAKLGAAAKLGEHLARVQQPFGIKRAFETLLLVEVALVEHR
jgi:hypothetical protein